MTDKRLVPSKLRLDGVSQADLTPEEYESALKDRALDAAAEGITIADARQPDRPLIYANKGFERLTGYPIHEVVGRNCRFLQGHATDPATVEQLRRAINEGRECVVELLNYHASGRPFWNRLSITPIKNDGGTVTHFIGVQSDITARRNAEDGLRAANRRITQNLEMAARIQSGFLPDETLDIDGIEVAWQLRSCDELAGDTLNVVPLDNGYVEFYCIDVAGHGVAAALLSVTLNHLLSRAAGRLVFASRSPEKSDGRHIIPPADVARALNRQFPFDHDRNQFFTLIYGVYNTESREFQFVSAGHPPLIYIPRSGESRTDWVEGVPIGVVPDFPYEQNTIELKPGDRVYIFSDGLIEAFNDREEPFGMDRFRVTLEGLRNVSLDASVASAIEQVEEWSQNAPFTDDVSIVGFEAP